MNFTAGRNSYRDERPFSFREFCHALGSCDKDQSNFIRPGVHVNKLNERKVTMKKNSQSQLHLILPKVGDQEYHFCLKTPEDFTKAAQALFDRQSIGYSAPPLKTVDDAKNYLLDNYREHHEGYYPDVGECPNGWQQVIPKPDED